MAGGRWVNFGWGEALIYTAQYRVSASKVSSSEDGGGKRCGEGGRHRAFFCFLSFSLLPTIVVVFSLSSTLYFA